jgi:DNA-binding transcriptional MerR regulator
MAGAAGVLTSGEFARRSRLSIKALRLYDRIGLLRPAEVVPGTGYRRYAPRQLYAARVIVLLRRLDMPLSQVAEIVGAPAPAAAGLLAGYPCGAYTQAHVRITGDLGFTLARTVRRSTLEPGSALETDTTVNAYAHRVDGPLALRMARGRPLTAARLFLSWDELALKWFEICRREGGVFHLWGHSWEVDARGDWHRLERVLEHIAGRPDVTYLQNRELLALGA